jgi:hypothetical protein
MKHQDERVPEPVVSDAPKQAASNADPVVCTLCRGPVLLCGGAQHCTGGPRSTLDLAWLVAIRAVYAGLVLTRTTAALWGGALLRLAGQLARGALASPPAAMPHLAAKYADPACAVDAAVAARLALAYLEHGDLDRLSELSKALRESRAPWLSELALLGPRAALSSQFDIERFALLAVRCDGCAGAAPILADRLYAYVDTYDAAIGCPRCGAISAHPLPGVRIGPPHPVGRCMGGARSAARCCIAHEGDELDAEGLCVQGRATIHRVRLDLRAAFARDPVGHALFDAIELLCSTRAAAPEPEQRPVIQAATSQNLRPPVINTEARTAAEPRSVGLQLLDAIQKFLRDHPELCAAPQSAVR